MSSAVTVYSQMASFVTTSAQKTHPFESESRVNIELARWLFCLSINVYLEIDTLLVRILAAI